MLDVAALSAMLLTQGGSAFDDLSRRLEEVRSERQAWSSCVAGASRTAFQHNLEDPDPPAIVRVAMRECGGIETSFYKALNVVNRRTMAGPAAGTSAMGTEVKIASDIRADTIRQLETMLSDPATLTKRLTSGMTSWAGCVRKEAELRASSTDGPDAVASAALAACSAMEAKVRRAYGIRGIAQEGRSRDEPALVKAAITKARDDIEERAAEWVVEKRANDLAASIEQSRASVQRRTN